MGDEGRERMFRELTGPFLDAEGGGGESPSTAESITAELTESPADESGSPTEGVDTTPAPATEASPTVGSDGVQERGPIPYDRHEAILANARQEYAWANGLDQARVQQALSVFDHLQRDPSGMAQLLQRSQQQQQEPQPDLQDDQGRLFYSAEQAARLAQYQARRESAALEQKFTQRIGATEGYVQRQQALEQAQAQLAEADTWPGFKEHENAITDTFTQAAQTGQPLSLWQAYAHVVFPTMQQSQEKLEASVRKKLLEEMKRSPTDTDPNRSAPSPQLKADSEKSTAELIKEEWAKVEATT